MHSGYDDWNSSPGFVPNPPRPPKILSHFWQSAGRSGNFYNQWNDPYWDWETEPKRQRLEEETNEIPQWMERKNYVVKDASKGEDELLKELGRDKERLEEQIEELKRRDTNQSEQGTQTETEMEVLEANSRLLEQKLEQAKKEEHKIQQQMQQLRKEHNDFVINARMKEAALREKINTTEDENAALKKENDALKIKTEAKRDRMFSEVQKLEHSHFVRERQLKEEMKMEKNRHEIGKTEMETEIRDLKGKLDAVRAAHKLIQEKREKKLKDEILEAEKIIKGLEEDKKRFRRTKTNSELLVRKLKHEILDLKTGTKHEKQKFERRNDQKNAEKCIRELRIGNQRLKAAIKSSYQSDVRKKIEGLQEKLKKAESELIKTQESLTLMTQYRDAAVQGGIQLELEHSSELNQMETDAEEREEHVKLLLSGMTPNEFVAQHQQLIDHQQSTEEKLEKMKEENKSLKIKNEQLKKRAAQYKESNTKLTELQTEKEALSKELQCTVERFEERN